MCSKGTNYEAMRVQLTFSICVAVLVLRDLRWPVPSKFSMRIRSPDR